MQIKKIKNTKLIAHIYFCLDYNKTITNKSKFVNILIKDIPRSSVGYAGFKTKKLLLQHLRRAIFNPGKIRGIPRLDFNKKLILGIIEKSIKKCHQIIPSTPTKIFIFPSFNTFKKDKMSGVGGFCPWKGTILIDINPISGWTTALERTICHEFNHSIISIPSKDWTLLYSLIFEGLADNFTKDLLGGALSPWTRVFSQKECKEFFPRIKNLLNSKSEKVYRAVFFENKKYPLWMGYSIGYQIVKLFLGKYKHLKWTDIMQLDPEEILEKSKFSKNS